ncbi:uncharacterized protein [Rutidosis leptorrhynchoides]|uniref:uncharacterized protein n=1 Tax=Rutidosis leptorrhynchoides TaxID=125765 RepID=UPI003A99EA17
MATWLGCASGSFPITYLGIPLGSSMKSSKDWEPVFEKFGKTLTDWKAKSLSSGPEDWMWLLSGNGKFSVFQLTKLIERVKYRNAPNTNTTPSIRNNLVPLKVEIFIWRTRLNRLPTRVELNKRGLDLGSVRCPVCDDDLKTVEHSIISCKVASEIWSRVLSWWKLSPPQHRDLANVFVGCGGVGHSFTHPMVMRFWQSTEWVSGYLIWKNRNAYTFSKAKPSSEMVFKEIQIKSFEWFQIDARVFAPILEFRCGREKLRRFGGLCR